MAQRKMSATLNEAPDFISAGSLLYFIPAPRKFFVWLLFYFNTLVNWVHNPRRMLSVRQSTGPFPNCVFRIGLDGLQREPF